MPPRLHARREKFYWCPRSSTIWHKRPFGEYAEGLFYCGDWSCVIESATKTTLQGPVLHVATSGVHWTSDAGQTWNKLNVPGTAYYPRSVQAKDGRIFVFGHVGGDNAYGAVDQSIVMDSFRLAAADVPAGRASAHRHGN